MHDRDPEIKQKEFEAFTILRKRFRMRDAGAGKWDALCPAHDDHNRSLRVYKVGERIYFRCYSGCTFNEVRQALGLPVWLDRGRVKRTWRPVRPVARTRAEPQTDADKIIAGYNYQILSDTFLEDSEGLRPLADQLGLPVEALLDGDCGRAEQFPMMVRHLDHGKGKEIPINAWTWPMRDADFNVTGIRLRFNDDAKRSFTGSVPGLFLGNRWGMPGPILILEGASDRGAGFAWGFDTIGLPSCNDGFDLCEALLRKVGRDRDVVILMQVDEPKEQPGTGRIFHPGQDGARAMAERIGRFGRALRIITPLPPYDDARKWYQAGATRDDVDRQIAGKKQWRPENRRHA